MGWLRLVVNSLTVVYWTDEGDVKGDSIKVVLQKWSREIDGCG